jgi:hypothetical protein
MKRIKLTCEVTINPDFSGLFFLVQSGGSFNIFDYMEAFGLDDIAYSSKDTDNIERSIKALNPDEWLLVNHEYI